MWGYTAPPSWANSAPAFKEAAAALRKQFACDMCKAARSYLYQENSDILEQSAISHNAYTNNVKKITDPASAQSTLDSANVDVSRGIRLRK